MLQISPLGAGHGLQVVDKRAAWSCCSDEFKQAGGNLIAPAAVGVQPYKSPLAQPELKFFPARNG